MNNGFDNKNLNEYGQEPVVTPPPAEEAPVMQEPVAELQPQPQSQPETAPQAHPQTPPPAYEGRNPYAAQPAAQPHYQQASYQPNPYGNGYATGAYRQPENRNPYSNHSYPQNGGYGAQQSYRDFGRNGQASPYQGGNGYAPMGQQPAPFYHPPVKVKKAASRGFVVGMVAIGMVICLLIGGLGGAALYSSLADRSGQPAGSGSVIIQQGNQSEKPAVTDKGSAAYVASVAADAVVEVTTETVSTDSYYGQYVTQGAGSGVIISSGDSGSYIITCAHVIEGATKVTVKLTNGEEYEASFTASDTQTDIGIIKIDVKGLKTAAVADFSKVVVGEEVVAIGNPLGELGGSVTNGIVSALDRDVIIDGNTYHLLQTNTEINPGNSGGGLFNMEGELIGVVNAKSAGENIEGLGFAIPIDDAMDIATELIENGYVTGRVKLGFSLIQIASEADVQHWWQYSRYFTDYGIYIIESESDLFHTGDRLVAIDSVELKSTVELKALLLEYKVGDTVKITVSRINPKNNRPEILDIELTLTEKTA